MARIDNLGDYNIVRDALYEHGGDAAKLFKDIGDTAVAEKRPAILKEGAGYATIVIFTLEILALGAYKVHGFIKQARKDNELIKGKDQLRVEIEELGEKYNSEIRENEEDSADEEKR